MKYEPDRGEKICSRQVFSDGQTDYHRAHSKHSPNELIKLVSMCQGKFKWKCVVGQKKKTLGENNSVYSTCINQ